MNANTANAPAAPTPRAYARLRHIGQVLLGLLLVECVIGIGLAMFVNLPSSPSFLTVFASIPLLTAHIVLAFLLFLLALYATVLTYRLRVPGVAWIEALVTLFLLFAIQEGFAFTFQQNNAYVGGMVVGFLGAFVVQVVALLRLRRGARTAVANPPAAPSPGAH